MSRAIPSPLAAALLVAAATLGCKESPTEPADVLSLEEAEALYTGILDIMTDLAEQPILEDVVLECALGGHLSLAGDLTWESVGDASRFTTYLTLDPDRCVVRSDGYQFTLDGNPSVRIETTVSSQDAFVHATLDGSMTGGVEWAVQDRSGTCVFDLETHATLFESVPVTQEVSGTLCGLEFDFSGSPE